jgi:hypothetical protein
MRTGVACLGLVLASCNLIFGIEPGEPFPSETGGVDGGLEHVKHYPGLGDQGAGVLASKLQGDRLWAILLNSGTVDVGFGDFVHTPPGTTSLVLTKLVP